MLSRFSSVDAAGLENAADTALQELETYQLYNIISTLNMDGVLNSGANEPVINSLDSINGEMKYIGSRRRLEMGLLNLKEVAGYIKTIQQYERTIGDLEQRLTYYETEYYKDEDGNDVSRQVERINYSVAAQIEELKSQIVVLENQIVDASRILPPK